MKHLILFLCSIGLFTCSLLAQTATSLALNNMGGFNNNYTYVRTDNIGLAPDGNTYVAYVYSAGPTVMAGIPQFSMTIYENVANGQRGLASLGDRQAPWMPTATIAWNPDGTRMYATGYAASLDSSLFAATNQIASGLIFENGEWRVSP